MGKDDDLIIAARLAARKAKSLTNAPVSEKNGAHSNRDDYKSSHERTDASDNLGDLALIGPLFTALNQAWENRFGPVARTVAPFTRRIGKIYRACYARFATSTDDDGNKSLTPIRTILVTGFLCLATFALPWFAIVKGIPFLTRTSYDAAMLTTLKEEKLFLSKPDIINADREIYQVTGCRDIRGCDGGDNTIYYRLRPNIIMSAKYWFTRFEPYDPAEISSAMVSELNDCTITYYGRRVKALRWYPYIISASCTPVMGK